MLYCFSFILFCSTINCRIDVPKIINTQNPKDIPPTPREAADKITVPAGFKVNLFAGDPDVNQPIAMEIDDKGRLWVVECYTYAKHGYSDEHRDRILIFEDTDRDGKADKRTVFWDQGSRLTSVLPGFGGAFILNDGTLFIPC